MKKLYFLLIFILSVSNSDAFLLQKFTLRNGTQYTGYIVNQVPGVSMDICAEESVEKIPFSDVLSISSKELCGDDLPDTWKRWAEKNLQKKGDSIALAKIQTTKGNIEDVKILEKSDYITYLSLKKVNKHFSQSDLTVIEANVYSTKYDDGEQRVYYLKSGKTVKGQYAKEVIGKTITLLADDDIRHTFKTAEVEKFEIMPRQVGADVLEISPMLDVVELKNGDRYQGKIIERNFENFRKGYYLVLRLENKDTKRILFSEINQLLSVKNESYEEPDHFSVTKGDCYINREKCNLYPINDHSDRIEFILKDNEEFISVMHDKDIKFEYNANDSNFDGKIPEVVRLTESARKKNSVIFNVSVKNILQKIGPNNNDIKKNSRGVCRAIYNITEPGLYAIMGSKSAVIFNVR